MTLDEARRLVAQTTTPEAAKSAFVQAGAVERYEAAGAEERTRLAEAIWLLLESGEDWERDMASRFFASIVLPEEIRHRIVSAYLAHGWGSDDPGARVLADLKPDADEIRALRDVYLAQPARHSGLVPLLLESDDDGAVWHAFATALDGVSNPQTLQRAFEVVLLVPARAADFHALLRAKGETVVRSVAARLGDHLRRKLLAGCGLT